MPTLISPTGEKKVLALAIEVCMPILVLGPGGMGRWIEDMATSLIHKPIIIVVSPSFASSVLF